MARVLTNLFIGARHIKNKMYKLNGLKIKVDKPVLEIIKTLNDNGYEAYIVGGCVRDSVLGRKPKDWDITTSALPLQVKSLFSNCVDTGIEHGTVMVIKKGVGYEVTTYRVDGEYKDGRHPENVSFTRKLEEDLKRRDFTINAFAYNDKDGCIDLFDGITDLNNKVIRAVGNPDERFKEDALRIMRAVRFAAQLGFTIEENTYRAITSHAKNLENISAERIRVEFEKTLMSKNPKEVNLYKELNMAKFIVPEVYDSCFDESKNELYKKFNEEDSDSKYLRLALFFENVDSEKVSSVLKEMTFDNKTKTLVSSLIKNKDFVLEEDKIKIKWAMHDMGEELFRLFVKYQEAKEKIDSKKIRKIVSEIEKKNEAYEIAKLAITGKEVIEAGVEPGEEVGKVLEKLLAHVIENPKDNKKEKLLAQIYNRSSEREEHRRET